MALSSACVREGTLEQVILVTGVRRAAATMFNLAAAAIAGGLEKSILVVGADSLLTGLSPDLALRAMTESRDQQYEMPFGIPVANTFAMTAYRHLMEYGTTAEQFAKVAVIHREHASRWAGNARLNCSCLRVSLTLRPTGPSSLNFRPLHLEVKTATFLGIKSASKPIDTSASSS